MRNGASVRLAEHEGRSPHLREAVYPEMFYQICLDFSALPDPRTLTSSEVRMYYNALRKNLEKQTTPGAN